MAGHSNERHVPVLRSISLPAPLRVLMLLILVSALALTTLAPALADMHPAATDGQRLEDQSADVQSAYRAVYGADAEAKWIEEHNKDLHYYHRIVAVAKARIAASMDMDMGMGMDSDMDMDMDMDSDMDSDMDMDTDSDMDMDQDMDQDMDMTMGLPYRIAADVIGRGTEKEFLAGTDAGVLYGIGISEDEINKMSMMDMMM